MNPVAKLLITLGIIFVLAGLIWQFGGRFLNLGHLPGDIAIKRENFRVYFPLATSILLSVLLSLVLYLFSRFGR